MEHLVLLHRLYYCMSFYVAIISNCVLSFVLGSGEHAYMACLLRDSSPTGMKLLIIVIIPMGLAAWAHAARPTFSDDYSPLGLLDESQTHSPCTIAVTAPILQRKEFDKLSLLTCSITSSKDTDLSNSQLPTSAWGLLGWLLLRKPFSLREVASNAEVGAVRAVQIVCPTAHACL